MTPIFFAVLVLTLGIAVFLIAQILFNLQRQKSSERLLAAFEDAAQVLGASISRQLVTDRWIMGYDEAADKLLFMQTSGKQHDGYLVDLEEIKGCTTVKTHLPSWKGNLRTGLSVETISLRLAYKNDAPPIFLTLYEYKLDPVYELNDREQQAKDWQKFISTRLTKSISAGNKRQKFMDEHQVLSYH